MRSECNYFGFNSHWKSTYYLYEQGTSIIWNIQGDPKQTDTFEKATTLLWVNWGKKIKLNPSMGQRQYLKSSFRIRIFWKMHLVGDLTFLGEN